MATRAYTQMLRCSTLVLLPTANPSPKHAILNMKGWRRGLMSSASMRLNMDYLPPWFSAPLEVWGKQQRCSTSDWPPYWRKRESSHILSMHQMAEVPIELLTDSILDQVFEGESLSEISINPWFPTLAWPSLNLNLQHQLYMILCILWHILYYWTCHWFFINSWPYIMYYISYIWWFICMIK